MTYNEQVALMLYKWRGTFYTKTNKVEETAKGIQDKINRLYPEKFHQTVTEAIKQMVKAVMLGAEYTNSQIALTTDLMACDKKAREIIKRYEKIGMVEGAGTGSGGIVLGMMDFPLLLSIKMKMLYELAAVYGYDTANPKERFYMLKIFELTFSSKQNAKEVYELIEGWEHYKKTMPTDLRAFDWGTFQQEYRDHLDLAKLFQLLPIVGAPVGAYVNHKLINKLGDTAIKAYQLRWIRHSKAGEK